jgi:hypothetical protein
MKQETKDFIERDFNKLLIAAALLAFAVGCGIAVIVRGG